MKLDVNRINQEIEESAPAEQDFPVSALTHRPEKADDEVPVDMDTVVALRNLLAKAEQHEPRPWRRQLGFLPLSMRDDVKELIVELVNHAPALFDAAECNMVNSAYIDKFECTTQLATEITMAAVQQRDEVIERADRVIRHLEEVRREFEKNGQQALMVDAKNELVPELGVARLFAQLVAARAEIERLRREKDWVVCEDCQGSGYAPRGGDCLLCWGRGRVPPLR